MSSNRNRGSSRSSNSGGGALTGFKDWTKKIVSSVGIGKDNKPPRDELLQSCKNDLNKLRNEIISVREKFSNYAEKVIDTAESCVTLARSVGNFYKNEKQPNRTKSIKTFKDVEENIATRGVKIFQEQLHSHGGLASDLGDWLDSIKKIEGDINRAEEAQQASYNTKKRLKDLQTELSNSQNKSNKSNWMSNIGNKDVDNDELTKKIKKYSEVQRSLFNDFTNQRNKIQQNVNEMMKEKYILFDRIYVQILECQIMYNEFQAKETQKFNKIVSVYRSKFPKNNNRLYNNGSNNKSDEDIIINKDSNKRKKHNDNNTYLNGSNNKHSQQNGKNIPLTDTNTSTQTIEEDEDEIEPPQVQRKETNLIGLDFDEPSNNNNISSNNITNNNINSKSNNETTDEFEFSNFVQVNDNTSNISSSNNKTILNKNNSSHINKQDTMSALFDFGPSTNNNNNDQNPNITMENSMDELFGLGTNNNDINNNKNRNPSLGYLFNDNTSQQQQNININKSQSSTNNNNNNINNNNNKNGNIKHKNNRHQPSKNSNHEFDPFDFSNSNTNDVKPAQQSQQTKQTKIEPQHRSFIDLNESKKEVPQDNNINKAKRPSKTQWEDLTSDQRLKLIQQNIDDEDEQKKGRRDALDKHEEAIDKWEFDNPVSKTRRNVRTLLTTVQNVVWPELNWKRIGLSETLDEKKCKKAFRRALRVVHPDRSKNRGDSVEQQAICERIFTALDEAWKKEFGK